MSQRETGTGSRPERSVQADVVIKNFIETFNRRELDEFVGLLHPEVRLHSQKGVRKGLDEARAWATRLPGGVQQTIELEQVLSTDGAVSVALIRRVWRWEEDGSLAGAEDMAWSFEIRDEKVLSWRPHEDRAEALALLQAPR